MGLWFVANSRKFLENLKKSRKFGFLNLNTAATGQPVVRNWWIFRWKKFRPKPWRQAERSKTRLEGWRCLRCIFPTFLDIFEKFRPREIFWHQLDQDRLRIDGKIQVWKKSMKKSDSPWRSCCGPGFNFYTLKISQKIFLVQKLSSFQFSRLLTLAQRPKNGSEDEWFFTLFDPLCPEGCVLGPMGWVFWSTPGGPPNHPPRPLVRLILTVL